MSVEEQEVASGDASEVQGWRLVKPVPAFWRYGAWSCLCVWLCVAISDLWPVPVNVAQRKVQNRANTHLGMIAAQPRALGTKGHDQARNYIVSTIAKAGLTARISRQLVDRTIGNGGPTIAATIENIVTVLPGKGTGPALLVAAHYDTVPGSSGVGDNAVAVAALLATMEQLHSEGPLINDVVFLFSDGEEVGRLGAHAFMDHDPDARRIAAALNFEGRGNCGRLVLFETGVENGWVVETWAASAPNLLGSSLAAEVYKLLPNDTDFSAFAAAGVPGLNMAAIGCYASYHTELDDIRHIDSGLVAEYSAASLAHTRSFAQADLRKAKAPPVVFFSVLGAFVVRYRSIFSVPIAGLSLVLLALIGIVGVVQKKLRVWKILICCGGMPIFMLLTGAMATLFWTFVRPMPDVRFLAQNGGYQSWAFTLGFILVGVACFMVARVFAWRKLRETEVLLSAAIGSAALGVVVAAVAPGAAYLMTVPSLLIGTAVLVITRTNMPMANATIELTSLGASILILLVVAPALYLTHLTLASQGGPVISVSAFGISCMLLPLLPFPTSNGTFGRRSSSAIAVLAMLVLFAASALHRFDNEHPRPDSVLRLSNTTTHESVWATTDSSLDAFTFGILGPKAKKRPADKFLPEMDRSLLMTPRPFEQHGRVKGRVVAHKAAGASRSVALHLQPAPGTNVVDLRFSLSTKIVELVLDGKALSLSNVEHGGWLQVWVPPVAGLQLSATVPLGAAIEFSAVARSFDGFTESGDEPLPLRPGGFMRIPFGLDAGDMAAVRSDFKF